MTKQELIDAIQAHSDDDATVHAGLLEAVQNFDADTDKLLKILEKHIEKTDQGHIDLIAEANDL